MTATQRPATGPEKIEALKLMISEGRFHHATHRHSGPGLFHGLYVYESDDLTAPEFFKRYKLALTFYDLGEEEFEKQAHELTRHNLCVGSYQHGG
jgi:hypothetical protein